MKSLASRRSALFGLIAVSGLVAGALGASAEDPGKPMIVKIHADWCGTCTRLDDTFAVLEKQVGSEATIVVLDVTDKGAVAKSRAEAERLGIVAFFDQYKGRTGTAAVLAADGTPVKVMKGEMDSQKYVDALREAQDA